MLQYKDALSVCLSLYSIFALSFSTESFVSTLKRKSRPKTKLKKKKKKTLKGKSSSFNSLCTLYFCYFKFFLLLLPRGNRTHSIPYLNFIFVILSSWLPLIDRWMMIDESGSAHHTFKSTSSISHINLYYNISLFFKVILHFFILSLNSVIYLFIFYKKHIIYFHKIVFNSFKIKRGYIFLV